MKMYEINSIERRNHNDRRTSMQATLFPIITRNSVCVRYDRRRLPDRRVAKIDVDEKYVRNEVFDLLFDTPKSK